MAGFTDYFEQRHQELLALLAACLRVRGGVDLEAFEVFRRRLLQDIAVEEQVLVPALVERLGRAPRWRRMLRDDHSALVKVCVLMPHREWLEGLAEGLNFQHTQKLRPRGFIAGCEALLNPDVLAQARSFPQVEVPPPADNAHAAPARLRLTLRAVGLPGDGDVPV